MSSVADASEPFIPTYRRRYLIYYRWTNRLEGVWTCVKHIFRILLPLSFGGAVGTLTIHGLVCTLSHQDFRHLCDNKTNDIISFSCGAILGVLGTMYLKQLHLWQRITGLFAF